MVRTRSRKVMLVTTLLIAGTALAGCMDPGTDGEDETRMAFFAKDAPNVTLESLVVSFGDLRVVTASAGAGADDDARLQTVASADTGVDLKAYEEEDSSAFLGEGRVEPGTYDRIIVEILGVNAGLRNETGEVDTDVPREQLVVVTSFEVAAGQTTHVLLDFDAEGSVVPRGLNGTEPSEDLTDPVDGNLTDPLQGNLTDPVEENATGGPIGGNETTDTTALSFVPVLEAVRVATVDSGPGTEGATPAPQDPQGFAFEESRNVTAGSFVAASVDLASNGTLVLEDARMTRSAAVDVNIQIDLDGDGVSEALLRGPLDDEVGALHEQRPSVAEDLQAPSGGLGGLVGVGAEGGANVTGPSPVATGSPLPTDGVGDVPGPVPDSVLPDE